MIKANQKINKNISTGTKLQKEVASSYKASNQASSLSPKNSSPNPPKRFNIRASIAIIYDKVISNKENLTDLLKKNALKVTVQDNAFIAEILYGLMRHHLRLEFFVNKLLEKPLKKNQALLQRLLCLGVYQLEYTNIPPYAAINETVKASSFLNLEKYKSLINAILREYERQKNSLKPLADRSYETAYSCPQWLILELKQHYGKELPNILTKINTHPPMWIRVNRLKFSTVEYQALLERQEIKTTTLPEVPYALKLMHPIKVEHLPLFKEGSCFVQDAAAQFAAMLLDAQKGDIVLDCCCAPGGKTTHIRELYPYIKDLVAIDSQTGRIKLVYDNLQRMKQQAKVICFDATAPYEKWSPYEKYDRILLDAPCSATGVIRRHPDIKWIRTISDISDICTLQRKILKNMWSILKPGGILVYATCSIIYNENAGHIKEFLAMHQDAELIPITAQESADNPGLQRLPGESDMDGFYYAKLRKKA